MHGLLDIVCNIFKYSENCRNLLYPDQTKTFSIFNVKSAVNYHIKQPILQTNLSIQPAEGSVSLTEQYSKVTLQRSSFSTVIVHKGKHFCLHD